MLRRWRYTPPLVLEHAYLNIVSGRRKGPAACALRAVLAAAELPYSGLMRLRNRRYAVTPALSHDLGRPTVSIGNITAGGTGKTPVVEWLASALTATCHRPAILMRGYRKGAARVSDEQLMLQHLLPNLQIEANPDRVAGAADILRRDPATTCFILDDAFQHRRARRNFDLVLINANEPFGFDHVHPRGLLREPVQGLRRASAILITHASEVSPQQLLGTQGLIRTWSPAPIFHCDHINSEIIAADGDHREVSDLATMPIFFFTGIGHPQSVIRSLKRYPAAYRGDRIFDDHHHYEMRDLLEVAEAARTVGAQALLTTEKDWVKLKPLCAGAELPPLYRLRLQIRFWEDEEPHLLNLISDAISAPSA